MGKKLREGSKQKSRAGRSHNIRKVVEEKKLDSPHCGWSEAKERAHIAW